MGAEVHRGAPWQRNKLTPNPRLSGPISLYWGGGGGGDIDSCIAAYVFPKKLRVSQDAEINLPFDHLPSQVYPASKTPTKESAD